MGTLIGGGRKGNPEAARFKNEASRLNVRESCLDGYDTGLMAACIKIRGRAGESVVDNATMF